MGSIPGSQSTVAIGETLVIGAPLAGWTFELSDIPDEAFASGALGPGVAIDPTAGMVSAPCAGCVVAVAKTRHAFTIRAENGAEILIHIGLGTAALRGKFFQTQIAQGDMISAGDILATVDLDGLAEQGVCLLSPLVVTNNDDYDVKVSPASTRLDAGAHVMTVVAQSVITNGDHGCVWVGGTPATQSHRLQLEHGLHARPAARIADALKGLNASVQISHEERSANAKSVSSLMALHAPFGAQLELSASGPDAKAAVEAVGKTLTEDSTEHGRPPTDQLASFIEPPDSDPNAIKGTGVSPGIVIATVGRFEPTEVTIPQHVGSADEETARLRRAIAAVIASLDKIVSKANAADETTTIFIAHRALLQDPVVIEGANAQIAAGMNAGQAWRHVMSRHGEAMTAASHAHAAERADDFRDLEHRVLACLYGENDEENHLAANTVVLAADVTPSQMLDLGRQNIAGIALAKGGPTSHAAILANAMKVPAVFGLGPQLLNVADGETVILDGGQGLLIPSPDSERIAMARQAIVREEHQREAPTKTDGDLTKTIDGIAIKVCANVASLEEATSSEIYGADGAGLVRTEFLFLDRQTSPNAQEQAAMYRQIADALPEKPVVIRTLDVGGDKSVAFLETATEPNPALGVRGIRTSSARPDLLATQLEAIAAANRSGQLSVMLPMVTSVEDVRRAREVLDRLTPSTASAPPSLGVMIETPAAALIAPQLANHADFMSIGTNDLAQYGLAMDREHPDLAPEVDALHPAILKLIEMTVTAGKAHTCPVSVCGAIASDATALPVLLGLGITNLSVVGARVPEVKAEIRRLKLEDCQPVAQFALAMGSAKEVRALLGWFRQQHTGSVK